MKQMTRAEWYAARRAHRSLRRDIRRFSLLPRDYARDFGRLPKLPEPKRSEVGELLLKQAARRSNKLYWIGYRKRNPPMVSSSSRIPAIPGWSADRPAG